MNKVFVVQGREEDIALLKACYRMLLPDCDVSILSKPDTPIEETDENSTPDRSKNSGRMLTDPFKMSVTPPHTH